MSPTASAFWWVFLVAALTVGVIVLALGIALVITQRRFLALHRAYAERLLKAQEEERAWVAREVHDDALQRVAMLVHELHDWAAEARGEEAPPDPARLEATRIEAMRAELEDLAVMLRRVAHRLHPTLIDQAGLVPALEGLASDVGRATGVRVQVERPAGFPTLPREAALHLYRIAQEALRNVVTHAGVPAARVALAAADGRVTLAVSDEGRGFATADPARRRGLGLISMSERARLAGGTLELTSDAGAGTTVRVTVPLVTAGTAVSGEYSGMAEVA